MEITGFDFFRINYDDNQVRTFEADFLESAKEFVATKNVNSVLYYGNILEPGIEREHVYEETLTKGNFMEVTKKWVEDRRGKLLEAYKSKYQ